MPLNSLQTILTQSIAVLVAMILLGSLLRHIGMFKEEHGAFFARMVTDITLPALIFLAISKKPIALNQLMPPAVLIGAEVATGLLAWITGKALRLSSPKLGALILASMFGSSAFLGYAVIKDMFQGDSAVLAEAAIISELGVGLLIFTLGVAIAIHFGANEASWRDFIKPVLSFFRSRIFFALVAGIVVANIGLPENNIVCSSFIKILETIASANTLMVTMTIGVMLRFHDLRKALPVVFLACALKLVAQPAVTGFLADTANLKHSFRDIVVIEASMPSAALSAVFAKRYKCDGELASILVFATFISSIFTIVSVSILVLKA